MGRRTSASARAGRWGVSLAVVAVLAALVVVLPAVRATQGAAAAVDPVLVAAGDIACDPVAPQNGGCRDADTAGEVATINPTAVAVLGDAQYSDLAPPGHGVTLTYFQQGYGSSWGAFNAKVKPVPGHYDWGDVNEDGSQVQAAPDYFRYFANLPSSVRSDCLNVSPCNDWYSYQLGNWTVIALDSECAAVGGCDRNSPEEQFLRTTLNAAPNTCILAYWHDPRFASGPLGNDSSYSAFWDDLHAAHAAIVLAGHDHDYERFLPQDPSQGADAAEGLTQFIVGTGGKGLDSFPNVQPNSAARDRSDFGVLELTLRPASADFAFMNTSDQAVDSGTVGCVVTPSVPTGATAVRGDRSALVSWSPAGLRPPRQYTVTPYTGSTPLTSLAVSVAGSLTSATVPGLANGASYTFSVKGSNDVGTSAESAPSNAVVPANVPDPPTAVSASPGDTSASVGWTPPADTGGLPITLYTITPRIGSRPQTSLAQTVNGATTRATVPRLANGTTYSFSVAATNATGAGLPSAASNPVTPFHPATGGGGSGPGGAGGPGGGPGASGQGYHLVASDGGIFNYGSAAFFGSAGAIRLNSPIVGMAATPGGGYWLVASDGGIFNYGSAAFFGSAGAIHLNSPIVGMAATPDGAGYWLVAADGGIFNYGTARFLGSTGAVQLNSPIVGMAATPDGAGYWLVAADGGIFNYGTARFLGSAGAVRLNHPIVGMAPTPDGAGYWLAASDGGIFNYGTARFLGSAGAVHLNQPVVAMAAAPDGAGYWLAASDGGIFNYGTAVLVGSAGGSHLNRPIVGMD